MEKIREYYQKQKEQEKEKEAQFIEEEEKKHKKAREKSLLSIRHERRSVEDVPEWVGWVNMLGYYNGCPSQLHRNLFTTLFETGGRISEILELKPENFVWNEEAIKVKGMVVKKYRKRKKRNFLIKIDEENPLAKDLISFVESCDTEYLFPKGEPFTGKIIPNEHSSCTRLYLLVREISDDLWPHWFRAQRASFNAFVRKMNIFDLKEWFMWKSVDTPAYYINQTLEGIAKQMGIRNIPS